MGEIGVARREFLYEMQYWEVRRVIRGYRKRNGLTYQLLRLCAYGSYFSMRDAKGKGPTEWLPLYLDDEQNEKDGAPISDEEVEEVREELRRMVRERAKGG